MKKIYIAHTQISNMYIDEWMSELPPKCTLVYIAISRKTIGWHKETDSISISQIEQLTGLSRPSVVSAIDILEQQGLIIKESGNKRKANSYTVNYYKSVDSKGDLPEVVNLVNYGSKGDLPEVVNLVNTQKKEKNYTKEKKETEGDANASPRVSPSQSKQMRQHPNQQKPKKETNPNIKKIIDEYHRLHTEYCGIKPLIGAKEAGMIKTLLKKTGNDIFSVLRKLDGYYRSTYWFDVQGNSTKNLSAFIAHYNEISATSEYEYEKRKSEKQSIAKNDGKQEIENDIDEMYNPAASGMPELEHTSAKTETIWDLIGVKDEQREREKNRYANQRF